MENSHKNNFDSCNYRNSNSNNNHHKYTMKITIKKVNKGWLVNGKEVEKLEGTEKTFFNEFLIAVKLNSNTEQLAAEIPTTENYKG